MKLARNAGFRSVSVRLDPQPAHERFLVQAALFDRFLRQQSRYRSGTEAKQQRGHTLHVNSPRVQPDGPGPAFRLNLSSDSGPVTVMITFAPFAAMPFTCTVRAGSRTRPSR